MARAEPRLVAALKGQEYAALLRADLHGFVQRTFLVLNPHTPFSDNWHLQLIAAKLEACRLGRIRRLVINVPPRSLKSIAASVAFPAWLLGHEPSTRIICASYGQDLSMKHAADCRIVMEDPFYRELFPGTQLNSRRQGTADFMTTAHGGRMATSVGGVLTGRGADFLIIDDPLKPDEAVSDVRRQAANDWFDHSLLSRLDDKATGVIIIIMQRLHLDDMVGHVLEQGGWEVLKLPAIATETETHRIWTPYGTFNHARREGEALHPDRESIPMLTEMRKTVGEYVFAGQYQQDPVPLGGGMVKAHWFQTYEQSELPEGGQIVQSWDTASKESELSDYSVCTTWKVKDKKLYLVDVYRARLEYPALKRAVKALAEQFKPNTILIEDKASGTQLIQELKLEGLYAVTGIKPEGDKLMRLHAQTAAIENGRVYLPMQAAWRADYLLEVTSFPKAKYDDQVDSTSQAMAWIAAGMWAPGMGVFNYYREQALSSGRVAY